MTALAYDEAGRALDEAEGLDAECGHMLSAKATLSMFRGEFDDALAYARRATGVDPRDSAAFKVLVQVSGGHPAPDEYAQLERLSENGDLRLQDRIAASFALADCLDAQGNIEAAFIAYERANELCARRARHEQLGYDRAERERQTERLMSLFPAAAPPVRTDAGRVPIFIVGMPRSGTTLIESIIGAHSRVLACGERQELRSIMQEFVALAPGRGMAGVPETTKQRWRESFWRELPDLGAATAVTDKNPWNFDALGLILDLFPHARVVHVRRDPVETGLSIFRNEFPKFASFAHRLEDIGHYYGEYARLMAHWQEVLGNRFMTIRYEDLVADFAGALPGLLRFCGLEWEEACRDFATSRRVIGTMSAVQARRPLTGFGQGRSARYARYLSPLIAALRSARVDLRSGAYAPDRSP
jgi:tetratricopeptide (TPR) repeat protein